ncbi:AraC family transcriptional regulator [Ruminococcus sp. 5_1_39BFAA]|uniref:AraC family transcriptional regulator n=1 Tax=Ruminococcus sp. 5_1_39BFAA TaxID=457412 RepID=UPI003564BF58
MHDLDRNEDRRRGTYEFPFEFHHIDTTHPRYVMSYHWHVEYEIIRILKGRLTVTLDEKSFTADPGDVIFVHSGILHSGIPDDCVYQCIVFDINAFLKLNSVCADYMQKIIHQEIMVYHHFTEKQQEIIQAATAFFDAMWKHPDGYEMIVIGQFYHFFGIVFGNHYYLDSIPKARRDYKRILQLKQVVEFIEKNYSSPLTLQQLSSSVSMSPKYFCRFFSEMTHQTPMDYLNRQRIEQACFQLSTTDDSITEIAYRNGFNDLSYFIRTFKKYKGITPGKYKKH